MWFSHSSSTSNGFLPTSWHIGYSFHVNMSHRRFPWLVIIYNHISKMSLNFHIDWDPHPGRWRSVFPSRSKNVLWYSAWLHLRMPLELDEFIICGSSQVGMFTWCLHTWLKVEPRVHHTVFKVHVWQHPHYCRIELFWVWIKFPSDHFFCPMGYSADIKFKSQHGIFSFKSFPGPSMFTWIKSFASWQPLPLRSWLVGICRKQWSFPFS